MFCYIGHITTIFMKGVFIIIAKIVSVDDVPYSRAAYKLKLSVQDSNPEKFLYAYVNKSQIDGIFAIFDLRNRRVISPKEHIILQDADVIRKSNVGKLLGHSVSVHMDTQSFYITIHNLRICIVCIKISEK